MECLIEPKIFAALVISDPFVVPIFRSEFFAVETMPRIHFLQQWFGLSDPAIEEALHEVSLYCEFVHLDPGATRLPDERTILRFRHLLEENNLSIQLLATINATLATKGLLLKAGTAVDATLIAAPSSTRAYRVSTHWDHGDTMGSVDIKA